MERGQLGVENRVATLFVFEGLVGHLKRERAEGLYLKFSKWQKALDCWVLEQAVCDRMHWLLSRDVPVDVVTWRPHGFSEALRDLLWEHNVPVRDVKSGSYANLSPWVATDPYTSTVYDPDPDHRYGYGFKARDFFSERF